MQQQMSDDNDNALMDDSPWINSTGEAVVTWQLSQEEHRHFPFLVYVDRMVTIKLDNMNVYSEQEPCGIKVLVFFFLTPLHTQQPCYQQPRGKHLDNVKPLYTLRVTSQVRERGKYVQEG